MLDLIRSFVSALARAYGAHANAQPEDQLKRPVADLIEAVGERSGFDVLAVTEVRVDNARPDIGVLVDNLLCGHVELKARGIAIDPSNFAGHNLRQWRIFESLPNLIYTNGREWRMFHSGREVHCVVLSVDPFVSGSVPTQEDADRIESLLRAYFAWQPIVPHEPRRLAAYLAPLTRILYSDVRRAVEVPGGAIAELRAELQEYLLPDLGREQFAHAYAQGITYTLLLARLEGAADVTPAVAAATLQTENTLLGRLLEILTQPEAYDEVQLGLGVLIRAISVVDPFALTQGGGDIWIHFYEHFLHAYDPAMAADYGVYYTPVEIVRAQTRWVATLLRERFGKQLAFAEEGVTLLDPAMGTGTYLVAAIQHSLDLVRDQEGQGAVPARASRLAQNIAGFEIMIGPYAVAYLRLSRELMGDNVGGRAPQGGLSLHLADTLDSPYAEVPGGLYHRPLSEQLRRSIEIKTERRVLVCLGNPPYDRHAADAEHGGGWIRHGDPRDDFPPLLSAFTETATGREINLQSLYNLYVYFWRWSIWKVLETDRPHRADTFPVDPAGGIVSFITASSYLVGPGFVGMREHMRREFDELWIIDLGGDNRGARRDENVFAIETPVAIAVGLRAGAPNRAVPAGVKYSRLAGGRAVKLAQLDGLLTLEHLDWDDCPTRWQAPFLPAAVGEWDEWPLITDLFPWQHSGAQFKRTWPIAPRVTVLERRWRHLMESDEPGRRRLFREATDRTIDSVLEDGTLPGAGAASIRSLAPDAAAPTAISYAWRSFDRQRALYDWRVGTYLKDSLWSSHSESQVFMTSLLTKTIGEGPGLVCTALIPDMDHFSGRGGKDVIPLFRDADATRPNITPGLLGQLTAAYGFEVSPESLFAYTAALVGSSSYTARFFEQLLTPGIRVPVTRDGALFQRAVNAGRRLIWLQTFGSRFAPEGERLGEQHLPAGSARVIEAIPDDPADHPEDFSYDATNQVLTVGRGAIGSVSAAAWDYEVSGYRVLPRWLGFRMRAPAGRGGSDLDRIVASGWTAEDTGELLKVLRVLEALINLEPDLAALLDEVVESDVFRADQLPVPTPDSRRQPRPERAGGLI